MSDADIRRLLLEHYRNAGVDEAKANEIYHDDAILDFPQGGERIRGRANIHAFRSAYPSDVLITSRRIVGTGSLWVHEGTIAYGTAPSHTVAIIEFRGDKVAHETIYIGDAWEPPAWRAQWVEPIPIGDSERETAD